MTPPSRAIALAFALVMSSACSDSTNSASLSGRWDGGNQSYPSVSLVLQQIGDSLSGTAEVTPHSDELNPHYGPTTLYGHVHGDSVSVLWVVPLSSGYSVMGFAGHHDGSTLIGNMNLSNHIVLSRQ